MRRRAVVLSLGQSQENLLEACVEAAIDELVVSEESVNDPTLRPLLDFCRRENIAVCSEVDLYERLAQVTPLGVIPSDYWLARNLELSGERCRALERVVDVLVVLALAPLVLAVSAGICLAIALCRDGPILYSHARVGQYDWPFRMFKFRTMSVDAELGTVAWSSDKDSRVTPLGRFLRRWRLDELPQFINVLRGEMTLIGPRPERPEFVATLAEVYPCYCWRHIRKPGLTGWAQVNLPYAASVEDAGRKLEYDLYYVRHKAVALDLLILVRTLTAIWRGPWSRRELL